jgi:hypothetical protein
VVKQPDAIGPVETSVIEMEDDLNRFFGEGSFAGVFRDDQQYETAAAHRLPLVSGMITFDAALSPDASDFRTFRFGGIASQENAALYTDSRRQGTRAWRERP